MKTIVDLDKWPRKDLYSFFKDFDEPFFGVTTEIDCTVSYQYAREKGISFFLYYLHKSLLAVNAIEEFLYRIEGDKVVKYEEIHASPTVPRSDGTFGFAYLQFDEHFNEFYKHASKEVERVSHETTLKPATNNENVIHYSTLPWINFTSLSHARQFSQRDSVPKISFGKLMDKNNMKIMSMSVHVNHALADGYHVGKYIELFQNFLNARA